MKLPGDPWNNRWSSFFYGVAWNFSMKFHGKCRNPSMENIDGEISMEFHGNWCRNPPWQPLSWNSMEIDVLILHKIPIPWRFFTRGATRVEYT